MNDINVIKRDGHLEPFDKEKLIGSIKKAMIDAKLSIDDLKNDINMIAESVFNQIGSNKEVDISEIRNIILSELEDKKQAAAAAWRKFDGKYKTK